MLNSLGRPFFHVLLVSGSHLRGVSLVWGVQEIYGLGHGFTECPRIQRTAWFDGEYTLLRRMPPMSLGLGGGRRRGNPWFNFLIFFAVFIFFHFFNDYEFEFVFTGCSA